MSSGYMRMQPCVIAMPTAIGYYRQVLEVAKELGDEELLAIPSSVIGQAMLLQGHYNKAEPLLLQAIQPGVEVRVLRHV